MTKKITLVPIIAFIAIILANGTILARGGNEIARLANGIEKNAKDLKSDFQSYYKQSSAYGHLMRDIGDILERAKRIDKLSHDPSSTHTHIKSEIRDLNRLTRHLDVVVNDIEKGNYRGSVEDGSRNVRGKMRALNDTIRSMERAINDFSSGSSGKSSEPKSSWVKSLFGS